MNKKILNQLKNQKDFLINQGIETKNKILNNLFSIEIVLQ